MQDEEASDELQQQQKNFSCDQHYQNQESRLQNHHIKFAMSIPMQRPSTTGGSSYPEGQARGGGRGRGKRGGGRGRGIRGMQDLFQIASMLQEQQDRQGNFSRGTSRAPSNVSSGLHTGTTTPGGTKQRGPAPYKEMLEDFSPCGRKNIRHDNERADGGPVYTIRDISYGLFYSGGNRKNTPLAFNVVDAAGNHLEIDAEDFVHFEDGALVKNGRYHRMYYLPGDQIQRINMNTAAGEVPRYLYLGGKVVDKGPKVRDGDILFLYESRANRDVKAINENNGATYLISAGYISAPGIPGMRHIVKGGRLHEHQGRWRSTLDG